MSRLEAVRRLAGVTDASWCPPRAPDDESLATRAFDWDRSDWPGWVTDPGGFEIGSRWRLTEAAMIVAPDHCAYPTLALIEGVDPLVRYRVDAGTRLTLLATYDPDEDERVRDLDMVSYYQWAEGWATRTFRIDDGPSAGIRVTFSADRRGSRFPFSSRVALASIVPDGPRASHAQQIG